MYFYPAIFQIDIAKSVEFFGINLGRFKEGLWFIMFYWWVDNVVLEVGSFCAAIP